MKFKYLLIALTILMIASCAKEIENTTSNGFEYKLLAEGNGVKPNDGDYVFFHVDMLADEKEQFNSRTQGQESALKLTADQNANIINRAMIECLGKTSPGDSLILFIPTDSLVGMGFPAQDTTKVLSYRLRITEVLNEQEYQDKIDAEREAQDIQSEEVRKRLPEIETFVQETYKYIASGKGGDNIQETSTGLKYIIHEEGNGDFFQAGEVATVQYYGILKSNGNMFDNSFSRGQDFSFQIGRGEVIQGWDEGLTLLKRGGKATLIIPYQLAYGEAGRPPSIPAQSDLIFYIEAPE